MRVLVVEDEVRHGPRAAEGTAGRGFRRRSACTDGAAGLESARDGDYDAIVLDVMLPGLSGYEVVRTLRSERNWVPVLMLSAKDGEYDQADGLDVGADDYLTKPFSYVVLVARLRALLRRGAPQRPAVLTAGDLRLDPAARLAARGAYPDRADGAGVLAVGVPDAAPGRGVQPVHAARACLGVHANRGGERRRGVHRVPPAEDRSHRSVAAR